MLQGKEILASSTCSGEMQWPPCTPTSQVMPAPCFCRTSYLSTPSRKQEVLSLWTCQSVLSVSRTQVPPWEQSWSNARPQELQPQSWHIASKPAHCSHVMISCYSEPSQTSIKDAFSFPMCLAQAKMIMQTWETKVLCIFLCTTLLLPGQKNRSSGIRLPVAAAHCRVLSQPQATRCLSCLCSAKSQPMSSELVLHLWNSLGCKTTAICHKLEIKQITGYNS